MTDRRARRSQGILLGALICAGLVGGLISPARAAESGGESETPVVGGFGVGDDLEASLDERDGSFRIAVPLAGQRLAWDSKAAGQDAPGFGPGWGLGHLQVQTPGGVQVVTPSGETHLPDPTHPSGLAGYGVGDVVFAQTAGTLDARPAAPGADPSLPAFDPIPYAFTLTELGGTITYLTGDGDPIARVTATGERHDWVFDVSVPHRLVATINPDGVETTFDWESEPGTVVVTQGANLPGETDPVTGEAGEIPVWRVELDGGRAVAVVDPTGGRVTFGYGDDGVLTRVAGVSGASTEIEWAAHADGTTRATRVRTSDPAGQELSLRTWAPGGDGTFSSGWPTYGGDGELFWSGDPSLRYRTVMADGATRVESTYNSQHVLISRRVIGTTPSGDRVLQEQGLTYPGTEGGGVGDPDALPGNWSRATVSETTSHDTSGGSRTRTERQEFDQQGRPISHTAADGTVTVTEYDPVAPEGWALPVGLPVAETVTAPTGWSPRPGTRSTRNARASSPPRRSPGASRTAARSPSTAPCGARAGASSRSPPTASSRPNASSPRGTPIRLRSSRCASGSAT